jgi:hypothetical protein
MDKFGITRDTRDQTDEEILLYTISDDALEAAAEMERGVSTGYTVVRSYSGCDCCVGKKLPKTKKRSTSRPGVKKRRKSK